MSRAIKLRMSASSEDAVDGNSPIPERTLKNVTKGLLMQMGFDEQQYLAFKHESEQLCGQKMQPDAKPANAYTKARLSQLAKTHLYPKWNPMVQRGLQESQQEQFWGSWMSVRHRYFSNAHRANNWIQDTIFPDPAGSTPESRSLLQSSPAASPRATQQPAQPPLDELITVPSQTPQAASRSPEQALSTGPRAQTPARKDVTWREVKVKVSFGRMDTFSEQKCRPLGVPFIRCARKSHIDVDEGTQVIASWLDLSSLAMLIDDHWTQCTGSRKPPRNNQHYILCTKVDDGTRFKIRDSNEFHLAFNKWLEQRSSVNKIWWISCVPPALVGDGSDSDIPDSEDPFFDLESLKRPPSSDNSIDRGSGAKRARTTPQRSRTKIPSIE